MDFIGIYIIISKSHPERYYIGSSINIEERWNTHKSDFKVGRRHSPHFQRHFEKYGINDFEFLILECTNYISKG
ncbi:MAG: GIY-YIG nuclease family protein [Chitinophagales bacterium]|nr:GIY-YIG nuclease family protein [Chitinophagales bacterium]